MRFIAASLAGSEDDGGEGEHHGAGGLAGQGRAERLLEGGGGGVGGLDDRPELRVLPGVVEKGSRALNHWMKVAISATGMPLRSW